MHCLFPKQMTNGKGGRWMGEDKKKPEGEVVWAGKKDDDSYYNLDHSE